MAERPAAADPRPVWTVAGVTAALAALALLAVAVSDQRYMAGEAAVLQVLNDLPTVLGWPLRAVMQLGTLWAGLVVTAVVAVTARRGSLAAAAAVFLATAVGFRVDNVVKEVIERPRPPGVVDDLQVREAVEGFGFPSGHTTLAFALAASLHHALPRRWRPLVWATALMVGLARMHVGVHWPADVLGGAALGTAVGLAAALAASALVRGRATGGTADGDRRRATG